MFKIRNTLCPFNVTRWNEERNLFNCSSSTNVYHCLVDERNRSGEICIQSVWVQGGYCPEYNNDANTVDTVPCDWSVKCPSGPFQSYDVYKYPVCLNKTFFDDTVHVEGPSSLPRHIISVAVGVTVLLVVFCVIALLCYRKRQKDKNGKEEKIHLLSRDIPPFYKTSIFHKATAFLKDGGKILCLIGEWGSGKSTTAKEVYMSRTGRTPVVIEDILNFDVSTCQDSIIVEEPLPRESISEIETSDILEKIISLCKQIQTSKDIFLIITSTEEAWGKITGKIKGFLAQSNELCCLDLNWKSLTDADLMQILHTIFEHYNPDTPFTNVEKAASKMQAESFGFPESCTLLSRCREFQNSPVVFLNRPLRYLSSYLEKMCHSLEGKEKFAIMVFMSVNDMKIDVNELNEKLRKIFRTCGLNADKIVQLQKIIPLEFVLQVESSVYVLQHEIIKRITLITFGKFYFSDLLKFSSKKDLVGWIKLKKTHILTKLLDGTQQASDIEPVLEINEEQWIDYLKKMESASQPACEESDTTNDKHNIDL